MRDRALRLLIGMAGMALVAACATPADGDRSEGAATLRVGSLAGTTKTLFAVSGQDKAVPYRIEWSVFTSGPQLVEAQRAKAVDVGLTADTPPIFAQAAATPVKIVAVERLQNPRESPMAIVVPRDSDTTTVAHLRGKRIGLTEGTVLQFLVVKVLAAAGLRYSEITPINLPPEDALVALRRGDIDALAAIDPTLARVTASIGARVLATGAGYAAGVNYQLVRSDLLDGGVRQDMVLDFLRRSARARAWANSHPAEWAASYAELNNIPVDLARVTLHRARTGYVPITDDIVAAQQDQADTFFTLGVLPRKLDVREQFDRRFNGKIP
jgi:sulfonate transport system substrate-binding protein